MDGGNSCGQEEVGIATRDGHEHKACTVPLHKRRLRSVCAALVNQSDTRLMMHDLGWPKSYLSTYKGTVYSWDFSMGTTKDTVFIQCLDAYSPGQPRPA